ncbi:hypothetical protein L1987_20211 [Smallanthus sonchifolius]|uniref:Uncharacterized protein n=1 Tax=Smallanthus sonchifolius TaxID=185202 RepID=A0ACB9IT89_9ASTR|nr:hypothetical protein L1987_20211 [Smallanthus sonchifolius]
MIRSEARGGENDTSRTQPTDARPPPSAESGSRQESREIHLRRKMMSKGKVIVQEFESERPRKKQRIRQEGLDEDILNMLSEASRNESSIMRSQIMALKEREENREKEVTKHRGMVLNQNRVIDALKKTVEKLSGIVTESALEVVDEGKQGGNDDDDDDDEGDDNPDKVEPKCKDDKGQGDDGGSGAGGISGGGGASEGSGASGDGKSGDGGRTGDSECDKERNPGGGDASGSGKGIVESYYSDLDGSYYDDMDEDEVIFDGATSKPDIRKFATLDIINPSNHPGANDLEALITNQCERGEAVIKTLDGEFIRVFDPMDMFMFDTSDLHTLFTHPIGVGAGNATKDETKLYMRVMTRALKMRKQQLELKEKLGDA